MKKPLFYKKYKKSNEIYIYYLGIILALVFLIGIYYFVKKI